MGVGCTGSTVSWHHLHSASANHGSRSLNIYSTVVPTSTAVYLVGLAKSFASYTLHITALSPIDGAVLATADVPSSINQGPSSFFVVSKGDHYRVVWLEAGQVKSVGLAPDLKDKPTNVKGAVYNEIINVGLGDHGMFVALKEDGSGRLMRLNDEGLGLKVIWEFVDSVCSLHCPIWLVLNSAVTRHAHRSILRPSTRGVSTRMATRTSLAYFGLIRTR